MRGSVQNHGVEGSLGSGSFRGPPAPTPLAPLQRPPDPLGSLVYSQRQVCRLLGRSPHTIRAMVEAGQLPTITLGKREVIPAYAVAALLRGPVDASTPGTSGTLDGDGAAVAEAAARALAGALRAVGARLDEAATELDRLCSPAAGDQWVAPPQHASDHPWDTFGTAPAVNTFDAPTRRRRPTRRPGALGGGQ